MLGGKLKSEGAQLMDPDDYVFRIVRTSKAGLQNTKPSSIYPCMHSVCGMDNISVDMS